MDEVLLAAALAAKQHQTRPPSMSLAQQPLGNGQDRLSIIQTLLSSGLLTPQQRQTLVQEAVPSGQQLPNTGATATATPGHASSEKNEKPSATTGPAPAASASMGQSSASQQGSSSINHAILMQLLNQGDGAALAAVLGQQQQPQQQQQQQQNPNNTTTQPTSLANLLQLLNGRSHATAPPATAPNAGLDLSQLLAQATAGNRSQRLGSTLTNTSQQTLASLLLGTGPGGDVATSNSSSPASNIQPSLAAQLSRLAGESTPAAGSPSLPAASSPALSGPLAGLFQQLQQSGTRPAQQQAPVNIEQLKLLLQGQGQPQAKTEGATGQSGLNLPPDRNPATTGSDRQGVSRASYPMVDVTNPGPHDVLLGRGSGASNHLGNIRYRTLINQHKPRYNAASRIDKPKVADEIVAYWRNLNPPGRFLTRSNDSEDVEEEDDYTAGKWTDVGDARAKTKTCQCLREKERPRKARKK